MISVKDKFPEFSLTANVKSNNINDAFKVITNQTYSNKWLVLFTWPKDFTFVCPTEIIAFSDKNQEFLDSKAQLLGCSFDSEFVHLAWRESNPGIGEVSFPMLSDMKRELCTSLGIVDPDSGAPQRATIIVDPEGIVRFVYVTDESIGRNPDEVLRVLQALQSGGLCPVNWKKGEKNL
ncbi:MAG: peroxiredoxin [Alphaproteobacteria bacterium]|nr:peroxiredoxin [Rickettsiales bacterium]